MCVVVFLFHLKLNLSIEKNNIEFVFYGSKLVKNKRLIDRSQKFDFRFVCELFQSELIQLYRLILFALTTYLTANSQNPKQKGHVLHEAKATV